MQDRRCGFKRRRGVRALGLVLVLVLAPLAQAQAAPKCPPDQYTQLPLPSCYGRAGLADFEKLLLNYLQQKKYGAWATDKGDGLRDTGPFLNGQNWGTHPAVRVWYSRQVIDWLKGDRNKPLPDGAMIIKEQYAPPAAQYTPPIQPASDWTVMIRDSAGAQDGWYWGELWPGMPFDDYSASLLDNALRPMTGFGLYCYNCHASAERELTFSSLNNIQGEPGQALTFRVDNSWRKPSQSSGQAATSKRMLDLMGSVPLHHMSKVSPHGARSALAPEATPGNFPPRLLTPRKNAPPVMVPEFYDPVVRNPKDPKQLFVTSDQCMPCHSGTNLNGNLTMMLQGPKGPDGNPLLVNVSPYAEWRWSPMGLAGRDPVFYAQFASEMAYLDTFAPPKREELKKQVRNLCFTCHGVMGKRQLDIDRGGQGNFLEEFVSNTDLNSKDFSYGGLARDGVSCTACHHIVESTPTSFQHFLTQATTGQFTTGSPNELYGPFKDDELVIDPMKHALGIQPRFSAYVKDSRLCGSCHVINLPVVDSKTPGKHDLEQATYLEWVNSAFQTEFGTPGTNARSCQDCHMPGSYSSAKNGMQVSPIQTQIAAIEDQNAPAADSRLPVDKINVRYRTSGFARHQLQGLNVFLLRMFDQFNDVLGVRKSDFMSGATNDVENTIDNFVEQAQTQTARLSLATRLQSGQLVADVTVANLVGHRFPSGVGFRRAFLELQLVQGTGTSARTLWASGITNDKGVILGPDGKPLPTEFFEGQKFQPHFSASSPITRQDQVQIYEELTADANDQITTSFIRRDRILKDNRLLPLGWTEQGPPGAFTPDLKYYLDATHPVGGARKDPTYLDGSGTSRVRYQLPLPAGTDPSTLTVTARLYYQSTPPYYLRMRFQGAPNAPATQRLKYLVDNLQVAGTEIDNWKLQIASTSAPVSAR